MGVALKVVLRDDTRWPVGLAALVLLLGFPLWLAILIGRRRYRELMGRFPPGCCRTCGYDLAGNVSGVCPECGTSVN